MSSVTGLLLSEGSDVRIVSGVPEKASISFDFLLKSEKLALFALFANEQSLER